MKGKNKNKIRNPYAEVMRELFQPKTIPDKKKQNNKDKGRKKINPRDY